MSTFLSVGAENYRCIGLVRWSDVRLVVLAGLSGAGEAVRNRLAGWWGSVYIGWLAVVEPFETTDRRGHTLIFNREV